MPVHSRNARSALLHPQTDCKLQNGQSVADAVHRVDEQSENRLQCRMVNCEYPTHWSGTELAAQYQESARVMPNLYVIGSCGGTDFRHYRR